MADTLKVLSRYGATQTRAIAKAAVFYSLGAALFCAENARQEKPLPSHKRREAYEGAAPGRKTERAWTLGANIYNARRDAVNKALMTCNGPAVDDLVGLLSTILIADARADVDDDNPNGVEIADREGRIIWDRLDTWVSTGGAKKPTGVVEKAARMAKAAEKLREDCPAGDRLALAAEMDKVRAVLADMAKALRALDADATLLDAAKVNGVAADAREVAEKLAA